MLERHSACTAERPGGSKAVERLLAKAAARRVAGRFETARRKLRSVLATARRHAAPLAHAPDRLQAMRSGRRDHIACLIEDHVRLAADVGEAYRAMGRRWIDAGRPA